jgi:ParB-like chromosome segregation protein Spo0J
MDYTFTTIPITKIVAAGVVPAGDGRKALQKFVRVAESLNLQRPVLVFDDGDKFLFIAGSLQFLAKKNLNIPEIECIVFKDQPPQELEILIEEFGHKHFNSVVEASCIQKLVSDHQLRPIDISRMLGLSKQIVSDTNAINWLPKEIRDDAISDQSVGKAKLIQIARLKVSESDKIALYNHEKQLAKQPGGKQKRGEIKDITTGLQKTRRVTLAFEKRSEQEKIQTSPSDFRTLATEFKIFSADIKRLLKKYDASYSARKALRAVFRR